jgi:hypothetical protein
LHGHEDGVTAVAFSPDSARIATASWDRTLRIWNAETGREQAKVTGTMGWLGTVSFSPDGRRILASGRTDTVKLLDAATGRETLSFGNFKPWEVAASAFSPVKQQIIAGDIRPAVIWDAASPEELDTWEAEESAAEESLKEALRERAAVARENGYIQDWLLLAPFPLLAGETGTQAVDRPFLAHESTIRPRAGDRVPYGAGELAWRFLRINDYFIDFNEWFQQRYEFAAAYAVSYINAENEHNNVQLGLGFDDQVKVLLNGHEVFGYRKPGRICAPDRHVVPNLVLRRGTNVLVLKIVNEQVDWRACVRILGADGRPLAGLRIHVGSG